MKARWVLWWIANTIWMVLFALAIVVVWTREVDGSGAIQTTEIKIVSFIVLLIAFVIPFIFQMIWLFMNKKREERLE